MPRRTKAVVVFCIPVRSLISQSDSQPRTQLMSNNGGHDCALRPIILSVVHRTDASRMQLCVSIRLIMSRRIAVRSRQQVSFCSRSSFIIHLNTDNNQQKTGRSNVAHSDGWITDDDLLLGRGGGLLGGRGGLGRRLLGRAAGRLLAQLLVELLLHAQDRRALHHLQAVITARSHHNSPPRTDSA